MIELKRDESGQATVFMALFLGVVMLGFLAFAIDVGFMFREKRMAQAAADAASVAAAEEDSYSGDSGNAQAAANAIAKLNGFDTTLATNPATVTLSSSTSGNKSSTSTTTTTKWMTATVSKPIPTFFMGAFNSKFANMSVSASATAGEGQSVSTCVCLEGATGQNLTMSNGSKITASTCGVTSDSSSSNAISIYGGSTLTAQTLGTVSTNWNDSTNIYGGGSVASTTTIVQGISSQCSPAMPAAPVDTTCAADPIGSQAGGGAKYTVGPNSSYGTTQGGNTVCYTSLSVGVNNDTVTLNPGIYVINGGYLSFGAVANKGGSGVFFYLENNASLTIANGANDNLSAPTSGTYSGYLFYQQASDTQAVTVAGGASLVLNGAIVAPGAQLSLSNGSTSSVTSDIVAQSMTMSGGGTLNSSPSVSMGTLNISGSKVTQ